MTDKQEKLLNLVSSIAICCCDFYFIWLTFDIIKTEVVRHTLVRAARAGKFLPFVKLSSIEFVDPFSEIEETKEEVKETIQ